MIGVIITIYFIVSTAIDGFCFWGSSKTNYEITGQFGDFIGGVVGTLFSLAGTLFVYLTFKEQSVFNKEQSNNKIRDRIFGIIEIIERRSKEFYLKTDTIEIKGLENISTLDIKNYPLTVEEDAFHNLYYDVFGITEFYLLVYKTNESSNYGVEEKEAYKRMIWRYSKNVVFFGLCLKNDVTKERRIKINHSGNRQTMLDIKESEINDYNKELKKYLPSSC